VVDFKNVVLIMTSNIGSQIALENAGADAKAIESQILTELRSHLRPEFINRIDEIVVYKALSQDLIRDIVDVQITSLSRILKDRKLSISLSDSAKNYLAKVGYDPLFGARPLKRAIYKNIQVPLSKKILAGEFQDGDKIKVDYKKGEDLEFMKES
jgi:ATP-dependent Clp protease ATP-binding subunit ClpB